LDEARRIRGHGLDLVPANKVAIGGPYVPKSNRVFWKVILTPM